MTNNPFDRNNITHVPALGSILAADEPRDAVHIAVVPMIAAVTLKPGQHIGRLSDGTAAPTANPHVGIVDPYLTTKVKEGDRFWLFIYPGQVTTLRHEWTHPLLPLSQDRSPNGNDVEKAKAEGRLANFADDAGLSYDELIKAARSFIKYDSYLCDGGRWEGFGIYDKFWEDYSMVTGELIPNDKRWSFFSCSC